MIRVSTYTSHPGHASGAEAEITLVKVEIMDGVDEVVLATGYSTLDGHPPHARQAANDAMEELKIKVAQAEKELRAMGLLLSVDTEEST